MCRYKNSDYQNNYLPTDECQVGNGGCDQICIDTTQSYECRCNTGYTLGSDGRACNGMQHIQIHFIDTSSVLSIHMIILILVFLNYPDINECTVNNGGCQQNCFNFQGSFVCWCNAGYSRDENGKTCSGELF